MVKATAVAAYMRHANKKQDTPVIKKDPAVETKPVEQSKSPEQPKSPEQSKQTESSSDLLYILDLSDINNKNDSNGQKTDKADKSAAILDLTKEILEKLNNKTPGKNERAEAAEETEAEGDDPKPSDETRKLTRLLVAAKTPDEVQNVLMDAYTHRQEWQKLASNGDKEAMKVVRKLNRLISRGNRKITDLNKEILTHQRQQRAEKAENKREAQRLENELKEAQRERKARERKYLQERDDSNDDEESSEFGPSMAETEAKIRQLAGAMAALKTGTANAGNVGSFDSGMADPGTESGAVADGAETSGATGGETSEE